jgi:RNA polymerase sigma-32 factor
MVSTLLPAEMNNDIIDSFDAYTQRIHNIPLLSAEEEHQLAVRLHENNDLEAAKKLVLSNLRFVAHLVRKSYKNHSISPLDLVQEGNIGLMKAVRRFNPYAGVRLITFAVHWIKSAIHDYIINNIKIIKSATTKAHRKLFFNLKKMTNNLYMMTRSEAKDIAKALNVTLEDVLTMQKRLTSQFVPLEGLDDVDENGKTHLTGLSVKANNDDEPDQHYALISEQKHRQKKVQHAMAKLDNRSRDIIQKRWLLEPDEAKTSLTELARQHNVSAERIRQIESRAMKTLADALGSSAVEND